MPARKGGPVFSTSAEAEPQLPVGLDLDGPRVHGAEEHQRCHWLLQKSDQWVFLPLTSLALVVCDWGRRAINLEDEHFLCSEHFSLCKWPYWVPENQFLLKLLLSPFLIQLTRTQKSPACAFIISWVSDSGGAVAQSVRTSFKGHSLVQLYWRGFESRRRGIRW